jgi:transcriptional regulator GlxA family with amidase domain
MSLLEHQCRDPELSAALAARIRAAHSGAQLNADRGFTSAEFDEIFIGWKMSQRSLDPRIAAVIERFQAHPSANISGQEYASGVRLSLSRFLHLFKNETGINFRTYRAWKRARNILHHVNVERNLAHFALDAGYPDSTHFSHSLRRIYGLQPSAIFSGSRRLQIIKGDRSPPRMAAI